MRPVASMSAHIESFLEFCRIEKGLARTTLEAYRIDLERFAGSFGPSDSVAGSMIVRRHIDSLYKSGMASRSIARHITTVRNLYKFLLENGEVESDPTALVASPKHWR